MPHACSESRGSGYRRGLKAQEEEEEASMSLLLFIPTPILALAAELGAFVDRGYALKVES